MNENDGNSYKDLHGACESDKQIYTELNQLQPDDRNEHAYYELHRPDEQRGSSQQQAPSLVNKPVIKMAVFLSVVLLIIMLLLGVIVSLTAVILITMTTTTLLDSESVQHLLNQQISNLQSTNTVSLIIRESTENTTQKLSSIADILHTLQDTSGSTANQTFSLFQNMMTYLDSFADQQLMSYIQINTNTVNLIKQSSENTTQKLINIVSTLNNLKGTSTSTAGVVDDILLVVEELLEIQNASVLFNSIRPVSCKDIKTVLPNSPTGYYHVNSRNIYCNMGELCGTGGGWTRLAYLDMSDSTVNCPTGFRLYQSGGVRACGRPVSSGGSCSSVQFPSNGISYSQICGRVVGYQYGSTDIVDTWASNNISTYYVDGVSITRGSPRQHVWTLMAGSTNSGCPCSSQSVVTFIGSNYFCESGNPNNSWTQTLYTGDPLWDGQGCGGLEASCCSAPGLPWFHRDYGNITTTDYIELRVCGDESTTNEDVPVSFYEIYIK